MKPESELLNKILGRNQNNFRLKGLKPFDTLTKEAQGHLEALFSSRGDRCHHAIAVMLWGLITYSKPVAVVSSNDLDQLINEAVSKIPKGKFSVRSGSYQTIWGQLTGVLIEIGAIQILKKQSGNSPGVIEVISKDWLQFIPCEATDELRLIVINSTTKKKFLSIEDFNTSKLQHL